MIDENTLNLDGKTYKAEDADNLCDGCAFDLNSTACMDAIQHIDCDAAFRADKRNVIWMEPEALKVWGNDK